MSLWTAIRKPLAGVAATLLAPATGGASLALYGAAYAGSASLGRAVPGGLTPASYIGGTPFPSAGGFPGPVAAASGQYGGGMYPTAGVMPLLGRALPPFARLVGALVLSTRNAVLGVFSKAQGFVRNKQVALLVREVGIQAAAAALGVGLADIALSFLAHHSKKRRRHGGITGRDLRCTKRTIRRIRSIEHSISGVCRTRAPRRGIRSAGGVTQIRN